ncbi:TonB-dependent receptor plug domain-containing protein [Pseudoxanthomonas beigongshangi]
MSYRNNLLCDAIRVALLLGATLSPVIAVAQQAEPSTATSANADAPAPASEPATGVQSLDTVRVTGSRIRRVDVETAQPIEVISRQDIEKQGFQSVGDILQNLSAMGNAPLSRASPSSSGADAGGTYVSLRDLGPERSLVLVNGRRMGVGITGQADVSLIPAAAVERIEVLKDGASSIYGADAIAGVVNIITRSNFEGVSASVYYGQYSEGDGAVTKGDMVFGFSGDRGSLTFAAEWAKEDRVGAVDRDYSRYPSSQRHPTDNWAINLPRAVFTSRPSDGLPNVVYNGNNTRVLLRDGGDPMNPADYIAQDTFIGTCLPNSAAQPGPNICVPGSTATKFNTKDLADLRIPRKWKSVYVDGILNITDAMRFRTNLLYSDRSSTRTSSGRPLTASRFNLPISGDSYFNPINRDITTWFRNFQEVPRQTTNELSTFRFSAALEGTFELAARPFDWDVSYMHNRNKLLLTGIGDMGIDRLRNALGPSYLDPATGEVRCGRPGAAIAGCVPFNPFIPYGTVAPYGLTGNQQLQDYLYHIEHDSGETITEVVAANLSGTVMALPAGDLGFAVGVERRKESGEFIPDAMAAGGLSTNQGDNPTRGSYSVKELYAELEVPLLADMRFARELSLNMASRYSDYSNFGDTTNNKIGLRWKPMDSLMLRATLADGFRAPTISDLYGGMSETAERYTDPCDVVYGSSASNPTTRANCRAELGARADTFRQLNAAGTPVTGPGASAAVPFFTGSNPDLLPETSKSQTIGVVWSPGFIPGFNLALDWWRIRIDDTIVSDGPDSMLTDCYVIGIASRCGQSKGNGFTRDPATGNINDLRFGDTNAGFRKVQGFDLDLSYRFELSDWGRFSIGSTSTYTVYDYSVSSDLPEHPISDVGWAGSSFRLRSNLNVGWERGILGASWSTRYYSGMKEACVYFTPTGPGAPPVTQPHLECDEITYAPSGTLGPDGRPESEISRRRNVGSTVFHDVQFRVTLPWKATVSVGANNVFNKVGPLMYTQPLSNYAYYGGFDIGRFLYMRYTQSF